MYVVVSSNNNLFTLVNIRLTLFVRCLIIFNCLLDKYFFCVSFLLFSMFVCMHAYFLLSKR